VADHSDNLRASDADRQSVADKLRAALDEGRLDLAEYDDRLKEAYAAKTYGDLKGLLRDLPPVVPGIHSQLEPAAGKGVKPAAPSGMTMKWIAAMWSGWLSTGLIVVAIWFATSVASGGAQYFWPIWVIGPWGAILLASTISGLAGGAPRREVERRARREAERERRRLERGDHDG
jgi:DUF1707 SHOCT-like domain